MRSMTLPLAVFPALSLSACCCQSHEENREVGRSRVEADEKEGAKYLDFAFGQRTPLLTAGYFELRAAPVPRP